MASKVLTPILLLLLLLVLAGCDNNNNKSGAPDSELEIRDASNNLLISTSTSRGSVTLEVGQQMRFSIMRVVRTGTVSPVSSNVTALVDYNFSNPNVASIDAAGRLTGLNVGFTTLEVVYREDNIPSNDDKVTMDVTISPR